MRARIRFNNFNFFKSQETVEGHLTLFCACAEILFLIRRNSFQSRHLRGKSFSIDLVSRVEVNIRTVWSFVRDLNRIFCFFMWISSRNSMSSRGGIRSGSGRKLVSPRSRLVSKENKKKTKERWEDEYRKRYIAVDVSATWKKIKSVCLYIPRTRHLHNIFCP